MRSFSFFFSIFPFLFFFSCMLFSKLFWGSVFLYLLWVSAFSFLQTCSFISAQLLKHLRVLYPFRTEIFCSLINFRKLIFSALWTDQSLFFHSTLQKHRITELSGFKGSSGDHPRSHTGSPTAGYTGTRSGGFCVSPERETSQPPWEACSSALLPST